jgi:hypothetical protein
MTHRARAYLRPYPSHQHRFVNAVPEVLFDGTFRQEVICEFCGLQIRRRIFSDPKDIAPPPGGWQK